MDLFFSSLADACKNVLQTSASVAAHAPAGPHLNGPEHSVLCLLSHCVTLESQTFFDRNTGSITAYRIRSACNLTVCGF